ncbi:hypothetical protein [Sphingomonas sp. GV3]|uniref:hypothetical protein n=1 Tax=Sphingomonas sp. GV3 TaxID=3040671 RepID=UPI00280AB1D6|nr:hypothetical protein [Sphingomonas sp. GV3]
MADDTDTPKTEAGTTTPRRRAPRKSSTARPTSTTASEAKPRRRTAAKVAAPASTVDTVEKAVEGAAKATTRRVRATAAKAEGAVAETAKGAKARVVKPRAAKRPTPRPSRKTETKAAPTGFAGKVGGTWGVAAIGAGVAAAGAAAAAALLSLRGSTPKAAPKRGKGAHTPDGKDASKSFEAGIADENTIPE